MSIYGCQPMNNHQRSTHESKIHLSGPAGVALGCTLVADLFTSISESGEGTTSKLLQIIRAFRHQVDSALPDMYAWFDETSLHVTIRALMG